MDTEVSAAQTTAEQPVPPNVEVFSGSSQDVQLIAHELSVLDSIVFGSPIKIPADVDPVTRKLLQAQQLKRGQEIMAMFVDALSDPRSTAILLKKNGVVVGATLAVPIGKIEPSRQAESAETAYILKTFILPKHQDKGYLAHMMATLEQQLRAKGFRYVERHAMIDNGYAAKILAHYGDQVLVHQVENSPRHGPQMFFRINLEQGGHHADENESQINPGHL